MRDWNDLKLILAISRAGALTGAARILGINHSTAFRRLAALEHRIGARLFDREQGGRYAPTPAGRQAALTAERIEGEMASLDRDITGRDQQLTGRLRVTASETLAHRVLTGEIGRFHALHPGIAIELIIDNRVLSLTRREADIALRVSRPREADLFGRKLADIAWTVYGTPALVEGLGQIRRPVDLKPAAFVAWDEDAAGIAAADWLADAVSPDRITYRSNSLINQFTAACAGIGLAVLPCYLADGNEGLRRALPRPVPELARELWIVTHADLRRTARVRAFFDVVGQGLTARKPLFAGRRPAAPEAPY